MNYLDTVKDKREELAEAKEKKFLHQQQVSATKAAGDTVVATVKAESEKTRKAVQKVSVQEKLATPEDIKGVVTALDSLAEKLRPEAIKWQPVLDALKEVSVRLEQLPKTFPEIPKPLDTITVSNFTDFKEYIAPLTESINRLELNPVFDPKITVKPADVKVTEQKIDLKPLIKAVGELKTGISGMASNSVGSEDLTPLIEATKATTNAINSLQFPVANYILPFKDPTTGKATQTVLTTDGKVQVETSNAPGKATNAYSISAISDDGTYKYFWFEDADKNYYIMRKNKTTKVFTYTKGTGGYEAVYQSAILGPSGSPTWDSYGDIF